MVWLSLPGRKPPQEQLGISLAYDGVTNVGDAILSRKHHAIPGQRQDRFCGPFASRDDQGEEAGRPGEEAQIKASAKYRGEERRASGYALPARYACDGQKASRRGREGEAQQCEREPPRRGDNVRSRQAGVAEVPEHRFPVDGVDAAQGRAEQQEQAGSLDPRDVDLARKSPFGTPSVIASICRSPGAGQNDELQHGGPIGKHQHSDDEQDHAALCPQAEAETVDRFRRPRHSLDEIVEIHFSVLISSVTPPFAVNPGLAWWPILMWPALTYIGPFTKTNSTVKFTDERS